MAEVTHSKWRIADIGTLLKNSVTAIMRGELLLRMNIGRHFSKYLFTFVMLALLILFNLAVENTFSKVEHNKLILKELEIKCADRTFQVASMSRRSSIAARLEKMGSKVKEPERAATILEK